MKTYFSPWVIVQKYPEYKLLSPNHPCFNNLKEVYNYKKDGNFNGLKRNTYFYSISKAKINTVSNCEIKSSAIEPEHDIECKELANTDKALGSQVQEKPSEFINPIHQGPSKHAELNPEVNVKERKDHNRKTRFTGDEILNLDDDDQSDLWEDFLPHLEISVLAGKGGIGKTMLYLQLALHIVTGGIEFLGRQINAKSKSVLIIATEDNERRLKNRIRKQLTQIIPDLKSRGNLLEKLIVVVSGADLLKTLTSELSDMKFDLVVIDALGDVFDGDQNSQVDARKFYNEFQKLIHEYETSFLFVTHEGKSQGKDSRSKILGSVAIVDRARSAFILSGDTKTGMKCLTIVKSNNISEEKIGKAIYIEMDPESLTFSAINNIQSATHVKDIKVYKETVSTFGAGSRAKSRQNKPGRKRDETKWLRFKELQKDGIQQFEIAAALNLSPGTISRWVKKINQKQVYDTSRVGDVD